jgi:protein phosphatase PTC2/3
MKRNLNSVRDRSGSCAVILLVTPSKVYCANIGDSRAIYSRNFGSEKVSMTLDHKPSEQSEKNRIIAAGGKVYQSNAMNPNAPRGLPILGPMRVMPGRLSVSRIIYVTQV